MEDSLISFTVYGEPVPWKRPRFNGKSKHVFEDSKVKAYKQEVITAFEESGGKVYEKDVPLRMSIRFYLSVPKSASERKKENLISSFFPTKRPDNDNLYKGIADALNGIAYYDDSQIVITHIHKLWSEEPRAEISIGEVKE
jgi:Holliday junction resolvase RusA-like endonuclease